MTHENDSRQKPTDWLMLAEVGLWLIFFAAWLALYAVPFATTWWRRPEWWRLPALAVPFFGALLLNGYRRRKRWKEWLRELGRAYQARRPGQNVRQPREQGRDM